jgi:Na+-translocating ferredoxin:NAD+ oxidoreductase RnfE subunit
MITREEFRSIAGNGIWKQNTSIVQILGLCPLLAVTTNAVNGIMLSLATIMVMAWPTSPSPRCATSSRTKSASRFSS